MNKLFPIYYETVGNPSDPCIILIAGIGGQLTDWPSTITQCLADNGFYVVTFDNRDAGLSRHYDELGIPDFNKIFADNQQGKPITPPYTLEDMAFDIIALMDELKIKKAHMIGASMGGIIAQYVALNHADRVLSLTCIFSTSGDPALPQPKKEVSAFFSSSMGHKEQSVESLVNNKLQLYKIYNHPDYFDEIKITNQIMASIKRGNYPAGFKRTLLASICEQPRTNKLKKMKVPCLIIHGDYDPVFSIEHGKQLAECIEGSHLEIIEKMGHGLPDYFAKKVVELIVKYLNDDASNR